MILGIGTDIIEIFRIRDDIEKYKERFLNRVFTSNEQAYCLARKENATHFAGAFAAKEAAVKALGTGFNKDISWLDVEVCHELTGKPFFSFSTKINELFDNPKMDISISHCKDYAVAFAIWHSNPVK